MKKSLFFRTLVSVFSGCLLLTVIGCSSAPAPQPEEVDIWVLLQQGDERARDFFIGEFDVNSRDPQGRTPLHYAVERGDAPLSSFFISLGADVNALDEENISPLAISVQNNNSRITEILVNAGADIHLPISENTTAAKMALAGSGVVFRAILTPASITSVDAAGQTILHMASFGGRTRAVNDILSVLSSPPASFINKNDNAGKNALDYAFERPDSRNHIEIAEQLILNGAVSENSIFSYFASSVRSGNFNIRRSEGLAPIHFAVMENHFGMIEFLLGKNIDINIKSISGTTPLHEAARTGNINIMRLLLDRGAEVNAMDAKGNTPLHIGIPVNVHREALNLLFEKGADPNLRDEHGDTPLHIAILLNRPVDVIQTLLGRGSDVHIRNMQGITPLYIAVQEGRTALIPLLLTYGSEVFASDNSGVTPFDLAIRDPGNIFEILVTTETVIQRDSEGNTMLHAAVRNRGMPRHIGIILDHRALVDARNRAGDTALHIAVITNQRENGEFLILRGANIFAVNAEGISPLYLTFVSPGGIRHWMLNPTTIIATDGLRNNMLHLASQWNLDTAIPVIINSGVSVEAQNSTGETPLFMAVKTNSPSTINVLLENRANLNARDNQGSSLLHTAIRWNAIEAASLLISTGIDINAHSLDGCTALHYAVTLGKAEIESMLIANGAYLEARDIEGNTPFMEAVRTGMLPSIERLASSGADTSTRNIRGDTPLHIAIAMERLDIVTLLLRMRASIHARNNRERTPFHIALNTSPSMVSTLLTRDRINSPDDMGSTALHIAIQQRASPQIINLIIQQGARINAVDSNGHSPLRIAIDTDQLDIVKILADGGANPFLEAIDNRSPAEIAFSKGINSIRAMFSGNAINATDNSSNTILHHAARFGTPETIQVLIELGANKTIRNIISETPMDIAIRWNRADNLDLLRL
jgi:hypothetical protein